MLSMFELDECRKHIDNTSLALYKLSKELRHDISIMEGDIVTSRKIGLSFAADEMEKKKQHLESMLQDYEQLQRMCEKAVSNIDDTKIDAQYLKSMYPHSR